MIQYICLVKCIKCTQQCLSIQYMEEKRYCTTDTNTDTGMNTVMHIIGEKLGYINTGTATSVIKECTTHIIYQARKKWRGPSSLRLVRSPVCEKDSLFLRIVGGASLPQL